MVSTSTLCPRATPISTTRSPLTGEELFDIPASTAGRRGRPPSKPPTTRSCSGGPCRRPSAAALVKRLGALLTDHKSDLADLVSIEVGKIGSEALGEIQEMIDICEFAVGLSRQLEGRTMPSERPGHRLMETWHPLGVVGVISAFNFPAAVWSWNAALALVCGDTVVWKPSEKASLVALAITALLDQAGPGRRRAGGSDPAGPDRRRRRAGAGRQPAGAGDQRDRVRADGRGQIGPRVAARFGRSILELGGNNARRRHPVRRSRPRRARHRVRRRRHRRTALHDDAPADRARVDRRPLVDRIAAIYRGLNVGNPFDPTTLVGPLIDGPAYEAMQAALTEATCRRRHRRRRR